MRSSNPRSCQRARASVVLLAALIAFVSASRGNAGDWQKLARPLHFPRLTAGSRCPQTAAGLADPKTGYTLGHGPVYPVLGFAVAPPGSLGVVHLVGDQARGGWFWHKTLWTIDPRYQGPVLIRGGRLDAPQPVRFAIGQASRADLRMQPTRNAQRRYGASSTLLRGPGCYALQIDGTSFSSVVVFSAAR